MIHPLAKVSGARVRTLRNIGNVATRVAAKLPDYWHHPLFQPIVLAAATTLAILLGGQSEIGSFGIVAIAGSLSQNPEPSPAEASKVLEDVLASGRGLIFSDNPEAIDAALLARAGALKTPYLRLALRNQKDLDRLMTSTIATEDGKPRTQPGRLRELIRQGGILLIDYNESDPKIVESFNSLFDRRPYFGSDQASPQLTVIGVMKNSALENYSGAFYSRFHRIASIELPFQDPLDAIEVVHPDYPALYSESAEGWGSGKPTDKPSLGYDGKRARVTGVEVQLFRGPNVRESLLGALQISQRGGVHWERPPLLRAIQGVPTAYRPQNLPFIIHGAPWSDPAFRGFLRQILVTRQFEVNGQIHVLPADFKIYRADTDFSKGIEQARLLAPGESQSPLPLWIINRTTQDILFERTTIADHGQLTSSGGILAHDSRATLRLRITQPIDEWVWHRIMHSGPVDVEVAEGVPIPEEYRARQSLVVKRGQPKKSLETFEQVAGQKSFLLETNDFDFAQEQIADHFRGRSVLRYPITPETTLGQLVASVEVVSTTEDDMLFQADRKGIRQALQEGAVVVLEGIEVNPDLALQLETALAEDPYLLGHGGAEWYEQTEGGKLREMQGQLIVLTRADAGLKMEAAHRTRLFAEDEAMAALLSHEFPEKFSQESFEKILRLREAFATIPSPYPPGLYPDQAEFGLSRLRLLYRHDNWLEAFENVFISSYADHPNVAAFLRTQVRLAFDLEEPGRQPHSFSGPLLQRALSRLIRHEDPANHSWELAEAMSLDLLKENRIPAEYHKIDGRAIHYEADRALIKEAEKRQEKEREAWYRYRSGLKGTVSDAPDIVAVTRSSDSGEQDHIRRIYRALAVTPFVMLKGLPGTGKSFVAARLAPHLGYQPEEVFGPITVGPDIKESDILARRRLKHGRTLLWNETVGHWASEKMGGLLVVDEANLTDPAFWNFLEGLFAEQPFVWIDGHQKFLSKRHRVVFTGNGESVAGRRYQKLIQRHAITVHFSPFDDAFVQRHIGEALEIYPEMPRQEELRDLILELHRLFERTGQSITFSLRDVQELVARTVSFAGADWTKEQVVGLAWDQYQGNFDPDQRQALELRLLQQYGLVIADWEEQRIKRLRAEKSELFSRGRITLVDATARMVAAFEDLVLMGQARVGGKTILEGKHGLILEGSSGRGKDDPLEIAARALGYVSDHEAGPDTPPSKIFYHRTARPDNNEELLSVIQEAKRHGSLVIISELNLLDSAFIEGKLNDVLTGSAHKGFLFVATINSSTMNAREKFSSALLNRVIYRREPDYVEKELGEILADQAKPALEAGRLSPADITHALRAHFWITEQVSHAALRPTPRELIRLADLWLQEKTKLNTARAEELLTRVYGPLYLAKVLKGQSLPHRRWLLEKFAPTGPVDSVRMLQHFADGLVRSARPATLRMHGAIAENGKDPKRAAALFRESDNAYILRADAFQDGDFEESLLHEIGHGIRTFAIPGLTPGAEDLLRPLYEDMEDLRHLEGLTHDLPASAMNSPSEEDMKLSELVRTLDFNGLLEWIESGSRLGLDKIFSHLLLSYARGLLTREEIERFSDMVAELFPLNPFQAVLPFLDFVLEIRDAYARSDSPEEHQFQQFRALVRLQAMREAYTGLQEATPEEVSPPVPSEERQREIVAEAAADLRRRDLRPRVKPQTAAPLARRAAPSAAELKARKEAVKKALAARRKTTISRWFERLLERLKGLAPAAIDPSRRRGAGVHSRDSSQGLVAVDLAPQQMRRAEVPFKVSFQVSRNQDLARISQSEASALAVALDDFVRRKLTSDKVYGSEGILDVQRLIETRDPNVSHLRSGGRYETSKKEIVLELSEENRDSVLINNPLVMEILHYFTLAGFTFTLYSPEGAYYESIRSANDLMTLLSSPSPKIPAGTSHRAKIIQHIEQRLPRDGFVFTSLAEIQEKVEAIYTYGLFRQAMESESRPGTDEPIPLKEHFERLVDFVKHLEKGTSNRVRMRGDGDQQVSELDLAGLVGVDDRHTAYLSRFKRITNLNLLGTSVTDFSFVTRLPRLTRLKISGTKDNLPTFFRLIKEHPNREKLVIDVFMPNRELRVLRLADAVAVPEAVPAPAFWEQLDMARELLNRLGLEGSRLSWDEERQEIALDLSTVSTVEFYKHVDQRLRLPNVTRLSLSEHLVLGIAPHFPRLKHLFLDHASHLDDFNDLADLPDLEYVGLTSRQVSRDYALQVHQILNAHRSKDAHVLVDWTFGSVESFHFVHVNTLNSFALARKYFAKVYGEDRVDSIVKPIGSEGLFELTFESLSLGKVARWPFFEGLIKLTVQNQKPDSISVHPQVFLLQKNLREVHLLGREKVDAGVYLEHLIERHPNPELKVTFRNLADELVTVGKDPSRGLWPELSFEEQLKKAQALLQKLGLREDRLTFDRGKQEIALDLSQERGWLTVDSNEIVNLTRLVHLSLPFSDIRYADLMRLPHLRILILPRINEAGAVWFKHIPKLEVVGEDTNVAFVLRELRAHPNPRGVKLRSTEEIATYFGFPIEAQETLNPGGVRRDLKLLQWVLGRLIHREKTLGEVRARFREEGRLEEFDKVLAALKSSSAMGPGTAPTLLARSLHPLRPLSHPLHWVVSFARWLARLFSMPQRLRLLRSAA